MVVLAALGEVRALRVLNELQVMVMVATPAYSFSALSLKYFSLSLEHDLGEMVSNGASWAWNIPKGLLHLK